jgi:hypothetical protein
LNQPRTLVFDITPLVNTTSSMSTVKHSFPLILDMSPYTLRPRKKENLHAESCTCILCYENMYSLYAVIEYNIIYGRYITYVRHNQLPTDKSDAYNTKNVENGWWYTSDEHTYMIDDYRQVLNANASMLFYDNITFSMTDLIES